MTASPSPAPQPPRPPSSGAWVALLILCLFAGAAIFAGAKSPSFREAPRADAVETSPAAEGKPLVADTLIEWKEDETPGVPGRYVAGDIALTLSGEPDFNLRRPVLTINGPSGLSATVQGATGFSVAGAQVGVGRIDAASPHPQVLFVTYTGGAHCCADIKLIEVLNGAWSTVDVAVQDGGGLDAFPTDLDGDGRREFSLRDDRFLYAFDAYAASFSPPLIKVVERGQVRDVSTEPQYRSVYEVYLPEARKHCEDGYNGACSAYVAAAARAGRGKEAWTVMLNSYDRTNEWALPTACSGPLEDGRCPEARKVRFDSYPEALRWFLGDAGYLPPVYIGSAETGAPSFDCAKAAGENPKLICATAELANADRQMAGLYWRVLAKAERPEPIVDDQRAFLATRDAAPPDVFTLLRLYQARIATLEALTND